MSLKTCTKCGEQKPATLEFWHKHGSALKPSCKVCRSTHAKGYYETRKDHVKVISKAYYESNKERKRSLYDLNRERKAEYNKTYYMSNKKRISMHGRLYRRSNRSKINERIRVKRESAPTFRLVNNMRIRMIKALKGEIKSAATLDVLGCSVEQWREHLEAQFKTGMTWENYGKLWHIDHIRPCASFDFSNPDHQKQCFHYSNTQPLWAEENVSKGAKWTQ